MTTATIVKDRTILHDLIPPEVQEITATGFTILHNQRPQVDVTLSGAGATYTADGTTGIQAGAVDGQRLVILLVDPDSKTLAIATAGNVQVNGTWTRSIADTWISFRWDLANAIWKEMDRDRGHGLDASGKDAFAAGYSPTASGDYAHAEGASTTASGEESHAEGISTVASGAYAHAEGASNTASGDGAHAEGYANTASGTAAHAEGASNTASGDFAHARGQQGTASGQSSSSAGERAVAALYAEHAHAAGRFAADGDAQYSRLNFRAAVTHDNTDWKPLYLDGSSASFATSTDELYLVIAMIVGASQGLSKFLAYTIDAVFKNDGGALTLHAHNLACIHESDVSYSAKLDASGTNIVPYVMDSDAPLDPQDIIRWFCTMSIARVKFPA